MVKSCKKVCLVITQLELGGAQKALSVLAKGLIERGYHVDCYCLYDKGDFVDEFENRYGIKFKVLISNWNVNVYKKTLLLVQLIIRLSKVFYKEKYDVIQSYTHFSNILVPLSAMSSKSRVFTSQRARVIPLGKKVYILDKLIQNSKLVQSMICVSESVKESCIYEQGINSNKLITIPNGIEIKEVAEAPEAPEVLRSSFGLDKEDFVFLSVARFHPQKGHIFLLDAITSIASSESAKKAKFIFVGSGELLETFINLAKSRNLSNCIFLGERNDILEIMAASDCFILPSLWEGMPNVVLEAMSKGLPVIATNVDGTKELIVDRETGVLVNSKNKRELELEIQNALSNPDLFEKMGLAGKHRVEKYFSLDKCIDRYVDIYQERKHE